MNDRTDKVYIGDGVYASHDGYHIWLTTEDGILVSNEIALEPPVFDALIAYRERLVAKKNTVLP